jgi:hypothetical protein
VTVTHGGPAEHRAPNGRVAARRPDLRRRVGAGRRPGRISAVVPHRGVAMPRVVRATTVPGGRTPLVTTAARGPARRVTRVARGRTTLVTTAAIARRVPAAVHVRGPARTERAVPTPPVAIDPVPRRETTAGRGPGTAGARRAATTVAGSARRSAVRVRTARVVGTPAATTDRPTFDGMRVRARPPVAATARAVVARPSAGDATRAVPRTRVVTNAQAAPATVRATSVPTVRRTRGATTVAPAQPRQAGLTLRAGRDTAHVTTGPSARRTAVPTGGQDRTAVPRERRGPPVVRTARRGRAGLVGRGHPAVRAIVRATTGASVRRTPVVTTGTLADPGPAGAGRTAVRPRTVVRMIVVGTLPRDARRDARPRTDRLSSVATPTGPRRTVGRAVVPVPRVVTGTTCDVRPTAGPVPERPTAAVTRGAPVSGAPGRRTVVVRLAAPGAVRQRRVRRGRPGPPTVVAEVRATTPEVRATSARRARRRSSASRVRRSPRTSCSATSTGRCAGVCGRSARTTPTVWVVTS